MPADTTKRRGTILQRQDGRWCASVMVERKRTYFYGHSREEVANALNAFLSGGLPTYDQLLAENQRLRRTVERLEAELHERRAGEQLAQ